ncbi:hypothetical protein N7644_08980 [Acinetobacter courvalinii]|uniref:Uncharacterized protein n=1 Tax=Acinetobacter courvalinii TaxID=280147 RepID=A0AA42I7N7_9GAMM|nr:hypothetical protein [Acinetobacter courvalinii]MDH0563821.1 hypothetical protein [Acinetobacter courvalinii]
MKIETVVLQDEEFKLHKLRKVQDTVYNSVKKNQVSTWLWIYAETAEFFNFHIWDELDSAYLNKIIPYKNKFYKVIDIGPATKVRYS